MLNLLARPCCWWEIHRLRVFSLAYKCLFYVKNNKASIQLNSSMCLISRPNFYVKSNWIICYLQSYMYKHHHRLFIFFWRKGEGTEDFYYKKNILFFHIHRRHVNRWSADGLKNFWVPSFFYKRLYNTGTPLCNLSLPFHGQVKSFVAVKCCFIIQHHLRHHLLPSASQYLDFNYSLNKKNETKVL